MGLTLHPEDRISHYRITTSLGVGGMGEVYVALDETLERNVALKILPPRLLQSEERVRRFIAEAKSASSLNHPNIVTIYEIGEATVRPGGAGAAGGEASPAEPAASIRFISMELITGDTLSRKIHEDQEDLRTLVGYIAQAAEGVSRAHASGIIHRDLKPGNIMVSKDGVVKVLDFGLAKLTEKQPTPEEAVTSAPTEGPITGEGVVMGTVAYMSPEQILAKPVDQRSDIFAMGCILYEAATRHRPFVADTNVEVMHRILRERPTPVEELNAQAPAELRRIIRRCLAKQPDERFQSMKDLAIDLREMVASWESLPVSGTTSALSSPKVAAPATRRRRLMLGIPLGTLLLVAGLLAWRAWSGRSPSNPASHPREMKLSVLMSRDDLGESVLSGDGRYLAYVTTSDGRSSLMVRQVRTGSDVTIVPSQEFPIGGIRFSPDGDYLYFLNRDPALPNYRALYQVASLGGTPRKITFDVDTAVTFSPDGREFCFRRGYFNEADTLVVFDTQTSKERELIRIKKPEIFYSPETTGAPAWSPDGKRIAATVFTPEGGAHTQVALIEPASGRRSNLASPRFVFVKNMAWMPDSSALMLSAIVEGGTTFQIYRLPVSGGEAKKVTNDLDGYENLSLSSDGKQIAATRRTGIANIWTAPIGNPSDARPITFGSGGTDFIELIEPLPDGGIAFSGLTGDHVVLWRISSDGSSRRQLTSQGITVLNTAFANGAGIVFTQVGEQSVLHVWRVGPDGSELRQLTHEAGEGLLDLSPDGSRLLYESFLSGTSGAWSLSLDADKPRLLIPNRMIGAVLFSPDGQRILFTEADNSSGHTYPRRKVIPAAGGETLATFLLPPGAEDLSWSPEGEAVTYIDRATGFNLMRRPIGREEVEQLSHFDEGRLLRHRWSPDGRKVLVQRRIGKQDSLWTLEPDRKAPPRKLVEFKSGSIFKFAWARDSKSAVFTYGQIGQDVVLLSEFD